MKTKITDFINCNFHLFILQQKRLQTEVKYLGTHLNRRQIFLLIKYIFFIHSILGVVFKNKIINDNTVRLWK